jgi:hypothetical protein
MTQPFRYDWLAANSRIEAAGEEPAAFCLVCLPIAGKHFLNALLERGNWPATFRVDDFDPMTIWDEIQDIVDQTENGLMTDCSELLDSLVTQITNNVTNEITQQTINIGAYSDACCYLESQPSIDEVPDETGFPTSGESDEICKSAQKAMDNGAEFLSHVFNLAEAGGGLSAGVIAFILGLYVVSLPFALLGTVIGLIVGIVANLQTTTVEGQWSDLKPDIVCAIFSASSPQTAKTLVDVAIDQSDAIAPAKALFKLLLSQTQINRIWGNNVGSTVGYSSSYCDGCENPFEWELVFDFNAADGNLHGWAGGGMAANVPYIYGQITPNFARGTKVKTSITGDLGVASSTPLYLTEFHAITGHADFNTTGANGMSLTGSIEIFITGTGWTVLDVASVPATLGVTTPLAWADYDNPLPILTEGLRIHCHASGIGGGTYQKFDNIVLRGRYTL